ncbi:MAG: ABC transporter permease [bacterium]
MVDPNFIETLNMQMVKGRNFSKAFSTDVSAAYILNETAVKQLGWNDPIGKGFGRPTERNAEGTWDYENGRVVGVIKDFNFRSLHQNIQPMVMFMMPEWFSYLSIRIRSNDIQDTLKQIENTWRSFEPNRPFDYFFLSEIFDQMYRADRRFGTTFGAFSLLAIFIACLGLFGLAAFTVEQRTKEVGIRKVLGATIPGILNLLSKEFTRLVIIANLIAWPIGWYAMHRCFRPTATRHTRP